jgi:hypothetical protein
METRSQYRNYLVEGLSPGTAACRETDHGNKKEQSKFPFGRKKIESMKWKDDEMAGHQICCFFEGQAKKEKRKIFIWPWQPGTNPIKLF